MNLKKLEDTFLNIEKKSISEIKELFEDLSKLEKKVSNFRDHLHKLTNELKTELIKHLNNDPPLKEGQNYLATLSSILETFPISYEKSLEEIDFSNLFTLPESIQKLSSASVEELEKNLTLLRRKEAEISFLRRIVHGWLDILKRELERRITQPETTIELILKEINQILSRNF